MTRDRWLVIPEDGDETAGETETINAAWVWREIKIAARQYFKPVIWVWRSIRGR